MDVYKNSKSTSNVLLKTKLKTYNQKLKHTIKCVYCPNWKKVIMVKLISKLLVSEYLQFWLASVLWCLPTRVLWQ